MRHILHAALISTALCGTALAQARPIPTVEKVVASGRTQKIAWFLALDPTCRTLGALSVTVLEAPSNGRVLVEQATEYPGFATGNPRAKCNTRRVPATALLYSAAPGYVGEDSFAVEIVGPLGTPARARYHVTVR